MVKYVFSRLFLSVLNVVIVITILYFAINIAAIDVWSSPHPIREDIEVLSPLYIEYLKGIINDWDFGMSRFYSIPVWELFKQRINVTLLINVVALVLYTGLGLTIGYISAINKNSLFDRFMGPITMILSSIPSFVIVSALMFYLGYQYDLLPEMYPDQRTIEFWKYLGLVIPVTAISLGPISRISRITRGELLETFDEPFLLLAQTKGLKRHQIIFRHMTRNTLVPVLPEILFSFVYVLGSSFIIEYIYGIPGIANVMLQTMYKVDEDFGSYFDFDPNVVIFIGTFYLTVAIVFGLIIDLITPLLDPRVRIGQKKTAN